MMYIKINKIQYSYTTKIFNKIETEGNYHKIIKVIDEKSTPNIILNCERLKAFSLRPGQRYHTCHFLLNTIQNARNSSQSNKRRNALKWKERIIIVSFTIIKIKLNFTHTQGHT